MQSSDIVSATALRYFRYTVLFERAEEGGYVVHVPALPGLWTQSETMAEALEMAREAIAGYLEGLLKSGEPIQADTPEEPQKEVLEIAIPDS